MSQFNSYTIYNVDGTKQILYGTSVENALDNAGFSNSYIANHIRDWRKGFDYSLDFVNGKWQPKESKNQILIHKSHEN